MAIAITSKTYVCIHTSADVSAVIIASKYGIPLSLVLKLVKCKACLTELLRTSPFIKKANHSSHPNKSRIIPQSSEDTYRFERN